MQAFWGARYSFLENGVDISSRTRLVLSDAGRPLRYVTRVSVGGWLEGASQAALSAAEAELRAALAYQYEDFRFLSDAGAAVAVSLPNATSLSGVRVVDGPNFTGATGAEYATLRQFDFELEAEYVVPGAERAVVSFTESISVTGNGGPVRRIRVPVNSPVLVRQQVSPRSVVRATQTGRAVGHLHRPSAPPPLWPAYLLNEQVSHQLAGGEPLGRAFVNFGRTWSYAFEADVPLVGVPNLFPV